MAWVSGALAVGCLLVGLVHVLRLAVLRRDVCSEATHAAMAIGMAAMFSPLGDPVPNAVWAVVFVVCGAWFGALAARARTMGGDAGHHVVGSAAMLFMLLGGHSHAPGFRGPQHPGHLATGGLGIASVAAIVLAGYFAWHVLRCADRLAVHRSTARTAAEHCPSVEVTSSGAAAMIPLALPGPAVALRAPVLPAAAHLVMAAAMTVMLLGMV